MCYYGIFHSCLYLGRRDPKRRKRPSPRALSSNKEIPLTSRQQRLPPSISKPFLEISAHLELPACATYAGLTLWNFIPSHPEADITDPDNLHVQTSFTGTKDEEWFMVISVAVEAKGIKLISLMRDASKAVAANDIDLLTALLYRFADGLCDLTLTLKRMYEHNNPAVFFHQLRPFLAGSKNMGHAGLPRGVYYDTGDSDRVERPENWLQLNGGSNAQSSLIQALDIFFGIKHSATDGKQTGGPSFIQVRTSRDTSFQCLCLRHVSPSINTNDSKCETICLVRIGASLRNYPLELVFVRLYWSRRFNSLRMRTTQL
jgi:hypothetical protein